MLARAFYTGPDASTASEITETQRMRYVLIAGALLLGGIATLAVMKSRSPVSSNDVTSELQPDFGSTPARDDSRSLDLEIERSQDDSSVAQLQPSVVVNSKHYAAQRSVVIVFDDGTEFPATLRSPQTVHPPYLQEGRLVDQYAALAKRANAGDGAAARMLYMELKGCEIVALKAKRASTSEADISDTALRCEGVTEDMIASRLRWVQLAAEKGDYKARQSWAYELGNTPEAFRVLEQSWKDGNASALPHMSILAEAGISASSSGEPDHVRAYAYTLIYTKLDLAARAANASWQPAPTRLDRYLAYQEYLNRLGGYLSPQQQSEAEQLAIQLVRSNANCCTGTF